MNKEDIVRMALEAGWPDSLVAPIIMDKLVEFAALVAAAEREACARAVEQAKVLQLTWYPEGYHVKANDIGSIYKHQHDRCLEAIRARGKSPLVTPRGSMGEEV